MKEITPFVLCGVSVFPENARSSQGIGLPRCKTHRNAAYDARSSKDTPIGYSSTLGTRRLTPVDPKQSVSGR